MAGVWTPPRDRVPPAIPLRAAAAVGGASLLIAVAFYAVLLFGGSLHGYDWQSHHFNYFDWVRVSMREFATVPLFMNDAWITKNFLANAESPSLSPTLPLLWLLPTDAYLKLLTVLFSAAGLAGMVALLRDVGVGLVIAATAAVSFAFGGFLVSHICVGHPWAMGGLALPGLLALFRRAALGSPIAFWGAAALNAATILWGQHQPFIWQNLLLTMFAAVWAIETRSAFPMLRWALVVAATLGLGAVKILPMLAEFADYDPTMRVQGIPLSWIGFSLFARGQSPEFQPAGLGFEHGAGWWEYAFYTGPVASAFVICGLLGARRSWGLLAIGGFFALLALQFPSGLRAFEPWPWLADLPVWRTQRGPSRFLFLTQFCLISAAAVGVQGLWERWTNRPRWAPAAVAMFAACVFADLVSQGVQWQRAALGPALQAGDHRPKPLRVVGSNGGSAELVGFEPNRLIYRAQADVATQFRFPFRLAEGSREWRVDGLPALTDRGKLAIAFPPGERDVAMIYRPEYFHTGLAASAATLIGMGFSLAWRKRQS